jgi:RimJ/RimL family protein N-acetyltransferase
VGDPVDHTAKFAVVELASGELAGSAVLWGIDAHNRDAHLGMVLRPACQDRGLATDVTRVLCHYGFAVLGLQRLQMETLADNAPMLRTGE